MKFTLTKEKAKDLKEQLELSGEGSSSIPEFTKAIEETNKGRMVSLWIGSPQEYDSIESVDFETLYVLTEAEADMPT